METWLIGVTVGSGVVFQGDREQAQEHLNAYVAHLEGIFKENGLAFVRKEHTIRQKGVAVAEDESIDVNASTNGTGLLSD